jgi:hypothetical protein
MLLRGRWRCWSQQLLLLGAVPGTHLEGGGSGDRFFGYRRITVQVRVRVTPSTAWMREATNRPS